MRARTLTIGTALALVAVGIASARSSASKSVETRTITSNGGRYVLTVSEPDAGFVRGKALAFDVRVARADDPTKPAPVALVVDADMPEHLHGTNRVPRIERRDDGTFRVENLYLHMPGWWEVFVDVVESPWTERAQFRVDAE